jgi:pilus assembly protein CpaE
VATNLAVALHNKEKPAVLVDADLQYGDAPMFLNLNAAHSIADLIAADERLDPDLLNQVLLTHESGLKLLAAPTSISLAEDVTAEHVRHILTELRTRFGWTIVDTPSEVRDLTLAIFEEADLLVLVLTPDISSVKRSTIFFDVLGMIGVPVDKVILVLNMVEARRGIATNSIEEILKREIAAEIPYDRPAVVDAINRGDVLVLSGRTRPFTRGIFELVGKIRQAAEAGSADVVNTETLNRK